MICHFDVDYVVGVCRGDYGDAIFVPRHRQAKDDVRMTEGLRDILVGYRGYSVG